MAARVARVEAAHAARRNRDVLSGVPDAPLPTLWFPFSRVLLLVAMVIGLKAVALVSMGEGAYRANVLSLSSGTTVERMVGILLTPDRLTLELARYLRF